MFWLKISGFVSTKLAAKCSDGHQYYAFLSVGTLVVSHLGVMSPPPSPPPTCDMKVSLYICNNIIRIVVMFKMSHMHV